MTALANTFVVNADQAVATSALARLKFVDNSLKAIPSNDEKITQGLKEIAGLLTSTRQALAKLIENTKQIEELTAEMAEFGRCHHEGRERDEGRPAWRISSGSRRNRMPSSARPSN